MIPHDAPSVLDTLSVMATLQEWGLVDAHKRLTLAHDDAQAALRLYKSDIKAQGLDYRDFQKALGVANRQKDTLRTDTPDGLARMEANGIIPVPEQVEGIRRVGDTYHLLMLNGMVYPIGDGLALQSAAKWTSLMARVFTKAPKVVSQRSWMQSVYPHLLAMVCDMRETPDDAVQTWDWLDQALADRAHFPVDLSTEEAAITLKSGHVGQQDEWLITKDAVLVSAIHLFSGETGKQIRERLRAVDCVSEDFRRAFNGQRYQFLIWWIPVREDAS